MPRFHVDLPLSPGLETALPAATVRHVQVLRLQPGASITLFDGRGSDWPAELLHIGRSTAQVRISEPQPIDSELPLAVSLAVGMPANERMDWLIEKATELGVAEIQPLVCERSVLRLAGERADKRLAHWRGVAIAAAEQCGRARLPALRPVLGFAEWLAATPSRPDCARFVLSLAEGAQAIGAVLCEPVRAGAPLLFLSGPEGGLSPAEDAAARAAGLRAVSLGRRVLRAETAPLTVLAALAALCA